MLTKVGYFIYFSKYKRGKNEVREECLKAVFYNKKKGKEERHLGYTRKQMSFCQHHIREHRKTTE